ncbi:hypothetical protein EXA18_00640 [Vibrio cincinnatiensis]|uniref:hypothetical protein n=1 Tax=Vibrio cincinnatiensis TaxID=675 RepID=UPI001EDECC0F|nr:hypothetical protein [Vibrio cincinnatiensis]MCG3741990.1 hypothetical protein [Vibrio cincinnatiensis]
MKTLNDFITEYYDNVNLKTFDKAQVDAVVNTCLCRYNTTVAGDFQPEPEARFKTELDYINYKLNSVNLLYVLKIGAIQAFTLSPTKLMQDLLVEYADKIKNDHYSPVPSSERAFNKYERGYKGFILYKTQEQQQAEIDLIRAEAEKLLLRKIEIENEELLDVEEAKAYAQQQLAIQQEQAEQTYLQAALKASSDAKNKMLLKLKSNDELDKLLQKDFLFFADIKAVVNGTNSELESILKDNDYISVRKYIFGGKKQATVWIKQQLADSYDYKAITPAA